MKKLIAVVFALMVPGMALAAGPSVPLDEAHVDVTNEAALQRGAKYFANYCLSCHAAGFARYNRVGRDLGLTDEQVEKYLINTTDEAGDPTKIGSHMNIAMSKEYGAEAFGAAPPDLTLVARVRGADWLYTYLRSFYADDSRPFGVNNTVFPNVGMPHVLWELQGIQEKVVRTEVDAHGHEHEVTELELVESGTMTPEEYDQMVRDMVTFLVYLGEPAQTERKMLGVWVLLFLFVLFVFAYFLKKEYWKDIH
jgi:ubiquinol-cytochrome c reductase cytochrome c1 subunit